MIEDPGNRTRLIAKVTMYGADPGNRRYELVTELTEVLPPPAEPEYIRDRNGKYVTYTDQRKVISGAKEGYVYRSYRVTYTDNAETEREYLYTDTYSAQPEKIYVGVKNRK